MLARLNPLNFLLGLLAFSTALLPGRRRSEGELTSGYLLHVVKET